MTIRFAEMRVIVGFIFVSWLLALTLASAQHSNSDAFVEEVVFDSVGITLAGTVLMPTRPNGTAAVMLPGSGPATRAMLRPAADKLVETGVTVMIFDKRGSGESGGDWTKSSLDDLAGDAIAAMKLLRTRSGIGRVGLWAHSQGNWVATRAAELGADPAFLVAISGGGVSPRESERNAYVHTILAVSPEDRVTAMKVVDAYFDYLSGQLTYQAFDAVAEQVRTTGWYESLGIDRVLVSETYRSKWQWVADYDPAQSADERNFPVLVLLGGADHTIPLDQTVVDWNSQLAEGASVGSRIDVFVGRDHHLRAPGSDHGHGVTTDEEIWRVIRLWLSE